MRVYIITQPEGKFITGEDAVQILQGNTVPGLTLDQLVENGDYSF